MPNPADQLDHAISALLCGQAHAFHPKDGGLYQLSEIASDLRFLPRPGFRARLRDDLRAQTWLPPSAQRVFDSAVGDVARTQPRRKHPRESMVPPLFSTGPGAFPVRGSHLAVSFALHAVALALVVTSGWWMVENRASVRQQIAAVFPATELYLSPSNKQAHGGGGGGEHDKLNAARGSAPRFTPEQLTSPAVLIRNENPILPAEPTVVGPLELKLPQLGPRGDPIATILSPPSDGTGSGGGIGSGQGGGIGVGERPGVGEGRGGGTGSGVYRLGGGVSAPRPIYDPDPEYSDEARQAKYQGSVILSAIIGPDGRPRNLQVSRSLGLGLDQKALEAVTKWRFEPARKDGRPVAVVISIEVAFRLY
jgi:protein TonB